MKTKIVLIDDEPNFTIGLQSDLETAGNYEVLIENDSRAAIRTIRETRPDLVILDIVMPNVEGVDIIEQLEADPELRNIPILVVTAMIGHQDTAVEGGVARYGEHILLAKPISTGTLIKCIEDRLAGRI